MKQYTHLLFDLDHTLWDFDTNCRLTLKEIHTTYELAQYSIVFEDFYTNYLIINNEIWSLLNQNKITKEEMRNLRFPKLLKEFGVFNESLAQTVEHYYLTNCPKKGNLLPHTEELLNYAKDRYNLSIITNGFEESQRIKIEHSNLRHYFKTMFTSESVNHKKPDIRYFDHVLNKLKVKKEHCLVIGDNPHTDIQGATDYGMDSVWINTQRFPKKTKCSYYFKDLVGFLQVLKQ